MKKYFPMGIIVLSTILWAASAHAVPISDNYWGGTYYYSASKIGVGATPSDEIGTAFSISGADVTMNGSIMTVKILGDYFYNNHMGVGGASAFAPGDLYINPTGWVVSKPDNNANSDTFSALEEGWKYVVKFYSLNGANNSNIYSLNGDTWIGTSGTQFHRGDQAWRGGYENQMGVATVITYVDLTNKTGRLTFTFDTAGLGFGNDVGFHWTMQSGNDVFEGADPLPTPEPTTMLLLGAGLVGVALFGRKTFRTNK
jgi:hypothetical protein